MTQEERQILAVNTYKWFKSEAQKLCQKNGIMTALRKYRQRKRDQDTEVLIILSDTKNYVA
ncbi:unnamed protein product [Kuraishia capsulata CBS 1993]|uniref:Uncharacterized protein n=1 Tax=Kuraishia capsulata CBS 1993 TaxID=1382522 RepID=W6MW08_9ASCO|nr:uncharacterized protein KUCA_T00002714001 [Kuraishia capsulata CBS 1993]CDK26740.1 unnamed protein product [Kuraishia capsulata CBS 1993]